MHKNWKAIAALQDCRTRFSLLTIQDPETLSFIATARPDLFADEPMKAIPRSALVEKEFKIQRDLPHNARETDSWLREGAKKDWDQACAALGIPTISFYYSQDDDETCLHMGPEIEIQLPDYSNTAERYGRIILVRGVKMIIVSTDGSPDCIVVAPLECIDLSS